MSSYSLSTRAEALERIKVMAEDIPHAGNRELFMDWVVERSSQIKPGSLGVQAHAVRCFLHNLGAKDVKLAEKRDWNHHFATTTRTRVWRNKDRDGKATVVHKDVPLGDYTLAQQRIFVRLYFEWLYEGELPTWFKTIEIKRPVRRKIDPEDIINREQLRKLLDACDDIRQRAVLATLHDSGLRPQELCNLNVGSVHQDAYGIKLKLPDARGNKTGPRTIRIVQSVPYLTGWMNLHPLKDDLEAPLFISMSNRNPRARMTGGAVWYLVKRAARLSGLPAKSIRPKVFRNTAASERAREGWNEVMLRQQFGWSDGSEMPTLYVSLASQDVDQMILLKEGKLDAIEKHQPALKPLICRTCGGENPITAMFCGHCHQVVSPKAEAEVERQRELQIRDAVARILSTDMRHEVAAQVEALVATVPGGLEAVRKATASGARKPTSPGRK